MHGHVDAAEFLASISGFLGCYYLVLALMNGGLWLLLWRKGDEPVYFRAPTPMVTIDVTNSVLALLAACFFTLLSALAFGGATSPILGFPTAAKSLADSLMGPASYSIGSLVVLSVMYVFRKFFVRPDVAWIMLNLSLLFMGLSMTDPNFAAIVTKPDNVPIVGMIFLLGYFTWLATYKAVRNDERIKQGLPPEEGTEELREKILVWPDLVYTELICMVVLTAILLLWAIGLQAPLEEPASAVKTPNPSKAPWYFLGLQEMLVYYDPWMAGVVLPSTVVFGLMAIPYLDFNKKGNGYYTIDERPFAYLTFQFGFLVLWVTLIVMGTFMRGPNWNFFGLYEIWDSHKVVAANNVDLSKIFWVDVLGMARPKPAPDASLLGSLAVIGLRESPGILLTLGYFLLSPILLIMFIPYFKSLFIKMGFIRYMVMSNLLLVMALLPLKMVLRWFFALKYFIAVPEYFLNF